jgi:hypothetical protein
VSKHTPTPWKIYDDSNPLHIAIKGYYSSTGGAHVADILSPANAAFILKAANSHDALVKALEWIVSNPNAHHANMVAVAKDALDHVGQREQQNG